MDWRHGSILGEDKVAKMRRGGLRGGVHGSSLGEDILNIADTRKTPLPTVDYMRPGT